MSEKSKVRFLKDWKYAHGGYNVVQYLAGEVHDLEAEAVKMAFEDGVAELDKPVDPKLTAAAEAYQEALQAAVDARAAADAETDEEKKKALAADADKAELAATDAEAELQKLLKAEETKAPAAAKKSGKK